MIGLQISMRSQSLPDFTTLQFQRDCPDPPELEKWNVNRVKYLEESIEENWSEKDTI